MQKPPFAISNTSLNLMVQIAEKIGRLQLAYEQQLHLRRNNRLRSIQASLAIENNSMSLEQVTDIINGKRVLGSPKEIQEVKNAFDTYEYIPQLSPFSIDDFLTAHRLLTQGLINETGQFRTGDVGIFNSQGDVIHMGARPTFVPTLVNDLLQWAKQDDTPMLIKSCVVHYEIEVIHPFADGNGRMGRLWQTVLLSKDNPVFEWLPIETMIYQNQDDYYKTLRQADKLNNSGVFIEFILNLILQTIEGYIENQPTNNNISPKKVGDKMGDKLSSIEKIAYDKVVDYLQKNQTISNKQAQQLLGKSSSTIHGLLTAIGNNKARVYQLVKMEQ